MRIVMTAAACAMLAACGGPQTSQVNNAQANISNDSRTSGNASSNASNSMAMLAVPSLSGPAAIKVMHARHEGMETIGKDFKALHREFDSSSPNLALIRTAAGEITGLSREASGWFTAGTGPEVGKTGAKPEIWQDPKDFAAKLAAFQRSAAAFNATTTHDDLGQMKARYADLAGTCKACHDKYRSEMHHDH
ncbi:MAG TPA: cytochrome c [Sphingomicrobium sp.]|jgi:cytochrome c556